MWCGFLPFAIVKDLGWLSLPVMGIISWLLYGLEEIGHLIEQPFVPVTDRPSYLIEDSEDDEGKLNMMIELPRQCLMILGYWFVRWLRG
jgi:hypothetical protein